MAEMGLESRGPGDLRHQRKADVENRRSFREQFRIHGQTYQKNQVMELICQDVAGGSSLAQTCRVPGMPSMRAVYAWMREDAAFKEAFEDAEKVRGVVLAEEVLETADGATQATAAADKIKVEAKKWMASKLNVKFADSQIIEEKHALSLLSEEEIRRRIFATLQANQDVIQLLPKETLAIAGLEEANAEHLQVKP